MEENKELDLSSEIAEIKKELNEIKQNNNLANSNMLNKIIDDYLKLESRINNVESINKPYEVINQNLVSEPKKEEKPKFELN